MIAALFWLTIFYLLMFVIIVLVSFLKLFIATGGDAVTSGVIGSIIIFILVTINLFLFSGIATLAYPFISKERFFEKEYRKMFFKNDVEEK